MKVGDLVNYTGELFDGPSVNGVILEINMLDVGFNEKPADEMKVYWATHGITSWCMEDLLEVSSADR